MNNVHYLFDCHCFAHIHMTLYFKKLSFRWISYHSFRSMMHGCVITSHCHCGDVTMGTVASQITSLTIVYSTVWSDTDQRKTSKLRVTGLCAGNSPVIGEFPAQMASNTENVSI